MCLTIPNSASFPPCGCVQALSFQAATIPGCTGIAISWARASPGLFSSSVRWGNDYSNQKCPRHSSEGSEQFMCTEILMQQIKPKAAKSSTPTTHLLKGRHPPLLTLCTPDFIPSSSGIQTISQDSQMNPFFVCVTTKYQHCFAPSSTRPVPGRALRALWPRFSSRCTHSRQ